MQTETTSKNSSFMKKSVLVIGTLGIGAVVGFFLIPLLIGKHLPPPPTVNIYEYQFTTDEQKKIFANTDITQVEFEYALNGNDIDIIAVGAYQGLGGKLVYDLKNRTLLTRGNLSFSSNTLSYQSPIYLRRGHIKALLLIGQTTTPVSTTDCTMDINFTPYKTGAVVSGTVTNNLYYNASANSVQRDANPHPPFESPCSDCDNQNQLIGK